MQQQLSSEDMEWHLPILAYHPSLHDVAPRLYKGLSNLSGVFGSACMWTLSCSTQHSNTDAAPETHVQLEPVVSIVIKHFIIAELCSGWD